MRNNEEEADETTPLRPALTNGDPPTRRTRCGILAVMIMEVLFTFSIYILLQDLSAFCSDELNMDKNTAGAVVLIFTGKQPIQIYPLLGPFHRY
jgi:hypothetical protein